MPGSGGSEPPDPGEESDLLEVTDSEEERKKERAVSVQCFLLSGKQREILWPDSFHNAGL